MKVNHRLSVYTRVDPRDTIKIYESNTFIRSPSSLPALASPRMHFNIFHPHPGVPYADFEG